MIYHKTFTHSESTEWVVLIHGAGGSSAVWFKQLKDFIRHFNVLVVDLRGHGKSKDFADKHQSKRLYSFREVGKDVVEVMEHLKIDKAHFIGVSLGTVIVRCIADIAADKVKSMILCGAVTRLNNRSQFLMFITDRIKPVIPFLWLYTIFAHIMMPRQKNNEARILFIQEAQKIPQSEFLRWLTLTAEINPLLRYFKENEVPVPTLYVMGDEDYMFLPQVKQILALHQYASLRVLDNCGHVCNVEQPELFNQLSIDFIKNNSNPSKNAQK
jgi:pimeloyl-ACP methyl ester carboxylesterase